MYNGTPLTIEGGLESRTDLIEGTVHGRYLSLYLTSKPVLPNHLVSPFLVLGAAGECVDFDCFFH